MLSNKTKIHGWINFDKPAGISSAKALAVIRKKSKLFKNWPWWDLGPIS